MPSNVKLHVIYIPGLGDGYDFIRKVGLHFWKRTGVKVTLVSMHWLHPHETYESKLERVGLAVDSYPEAEVLLVGESAGGALAIGARHRYGRRVSRLVTVCGMNQGVGDVSPHLYRKNKAFKDAMSAADKIIPSLSSAEKASMLTVYSSRDFTVRSKNTLIPGVPAYDLKTIGHMPSILVVLLKGVPSR